MMTIRSVIRFVYSFLIFKIFGLFTELQHIIMKVAKYQFENKIFRGFYKDDIDKG